MTLSSVSDRLGAVILNAFEHAAAAKRLRTWYRGVKYTIIELAADIPSDLCAPTMLTWRVCMNLLRMPIIFWLNKHLSISSIRNCKIAR